MISPQHPRSKGSFVPSREVAEKLRTALTHDWEKATGVKLHSMDVRVPVDATSGSDMYHSSISLRIGAPNADVPTSKYIKGVQSIIDTVEMYL
jgi:hypothetical protein